MVLSLVPGALVTSGHSATSAPSALLRQRQVHREDVARCTIERLMRARGRQRVIPACPGMDSRASNDAAAAVTSGQKEEER